ncbi:hypothetical protein KOE80_04460 [Alcaligenes sp. 13f]|uniref:hypothetical protein n=1 Tax=Alcaligenes sp. 13f TaxID=2841924 RepID=UPI001CF63787|nr:hypothetical protein [Alcaligenes sp. 13f]MCB4321457.1 hypothetical protein [Alcaligenes sp. 13f]
MKRYSRNMIAVMACTMAPIMAFAQGPTLPDADMLIREVRDYVDRILVNAGDHYRGDAATPLLADGLNPHDGTQLSWVFPDGRSAVLSNFSAQQNFLRVLTGLSALTGTSAYRQRAVDLVRYHFDHYQDAGGLLIWGGHRFIDLKTLQPEGPSEKEQVHELKNAYPYYDLMFEVDTPATVRMIRAFWQAHVHNWRTLETSRHGEYGLGPGKGWEHEFEQPPPFQATKGLSFLNTGNDLIYAGLKLYQRENEAGALRWAQRLAQQYVLARDPGTGLGVYQFTQPLKRDTSKDDNDTHSKFGDRAQRQFGPEFGPNALEGNMLLKGKTSTLYAENALMQLQAAQDLGAVGQDLLTWTLDGLKAFAKHAYQPQTNTFTPMLADGRDLSGYVLPRDGYYGKRGQVLEPYVAGGEFMLSYARAYRVDQDPVLWKVVRGIASAQGLGDLGSQPGHGMKLNIETDNDDPRAIFVLLDLYAASRRQEYLTLARAVAGNILDKRLHHGYFMPGPDYQYANIDAIEPYALLALAGVLADKPDAMPTFLNGAGFTEGAHRMPDGGKRVATRDFELFALKVGESLRPNGRK